MEHAYRKLMRDIRVPAGLNDRVAQAAGQRQAEQTGPKRLARRSHPLLRGAVCAACALALVLGSVTLRPAESGGETPEGPALVPVYTFGLTACAADTGEAYGRGVNGGLAFSAGSGMQWSGDSGYFTGCLLQITGADIRQVSLSLDRGELYRWRRLDNLTEQERADIRAAQERGEMVPASIDQAEDGTWSTQEMSRLGAACTEDYDPEVRYGLWVPGADEAAWAADPRAASQASVDTLDGASLTVTVVFADGGEQTKTYRLSTGKLRVVWNEDGTTGLLPGLAGDDEAYFYGVYAASETESRWLRWPVEGAGTVRMSSPFGGEVFHSGIDIPAADGTPILAAADGTVKEAGFDSRRGNYLVLDHGDGLETVYAQCRSLAVKAGDAVHAGETVAAVGSTGMSTGPHLCFQVRQDGAEQDPVAYFDSDIRESLHME